MSTRRPIWIAALYGFVLLTCSISVAKADRRVALVVGNSNYSNASLFLSNPRNDATDVAAALRGVGFEVLQVIDANKRDLDLNMAKFARLAIDADAALFYYAGHAVQYQGRNYLMPTDAEVEDEISFRYQMTPLDDVRAALDRGDGVKIVILDACRNNPIAERLNRIANGGQTRSAATTRGLARIDKTQGMVVAYATAADDVALDGNNAVNSPFTQALIKEMQEPGLEIGTMFRRVARDVNDATGGRQRPETSISLLSEYYLNQSDRKVWEIMRETADIPQIPRPVWEGLFPRPFWPELTRDAAANQLDPHIVASLIRQESEFNPSAISTANAMGLMQLLPSVGKGLAKQMKIKHFSADDLLVADTNLRMGTRYFRQMVDHFGGQVEYALAAYNAGEDRVDDWRKNGNFADVEEFVESIPFTQTREYVQAIMRNAVIYKLLYSKG